MGNRRGATIPAGTPATAGRLRWVGVLAITSCPRYLSFGTCPKTSYPWRTIYPTRNAFQLCCLSPRPEGFLSHGRDIQTLKSVTEVAAADDANLIEKRVAELEAWLDHVGVDRGCGSSGPPSVAIAYFEGRGLGLKCSRDLERDSTVRTSRTGSIR